MYVKISQGGKLLHTHTALGRGSFNLLMPLKLHWAVQVDAGYVSKGKRAANIPG